MGIKPKSPGSVATVSIFEVFSLPNSALTARTTNVGCVMFKRTPIPNGFGCAADAALSGLPKELVQHGLDITRAACLFHRGPQPRDCMVVLMPSDHVAGAPDLSSRSEAYQLSNWT